MNFIPKIKKYRFLLLAISGFLTSLPLVIPEIGMIQWFTMIPAALVLMSLAEERKIKIRKFYAWGLIYFMFYYVVVFHWFLYMYPMEFTGMSKGAAAVVVGFACIGLSFFQAVGSSLIFPIYAVLSRTRAFEKIPLLRPFCAVCIWTAAEWTQTIGWWGVPWGRLSLGQSNHTVMLLSSSLFGSYFVTFLIVLVNFMLAYAFLHADKTKIVATVAAGALVLDLGIGIVISTTYENDGEMVVAAAIQGNISSHDKWSPDRFQNTLDIYEKYTLEAAEQGATLIVWPETALPYNLFENDGLVEFVSDLAVETGATILVSAFTEEEGADYTDSGDDGLYNSVIEVRPDGTFGETIYSKQKLVPFGEFVPMRDIVMTLVPPLANIGMLDDDLLWGKGSQVMDTDVGRIGSAICFDSIYESVILSSVRDGAQLICVSTNDSWFLDSAAVYMHNSQSRLRAIESGRYIVRAANTGVSSIINPLGEVEQELGALVDGYIVGEIYMRDNATLYSVIGNLFVYLCIAFAAGCGAASAVIYTVEKRRK